MDDARKRHLFGGGAIVLAGAEETLRRKSISRPSNAGARKEARQSDALKEMDANARKLEVAILKKAKIEREVVEKDGFVFKRRKRTPEPAARPAPRAPAPAHSKPCAQPKPAARLAPKAVTLDYPSQPVVLNIHEALPSHWDEEKRLLQLVENICVMEEDGVQAVFTGPHSFVSSAVGSVLKDFQLQLEQGIMRREIVLGEDKEAAAKAELEDRKGKLRVLKEKFLQEEREWEEIRGQYTQGLPAPAGQVAEEAAVEDAVRAAREEVAEGNSAGSLSGALSAAHRNVAFQVDALMSMVRTVESMSGRAETITSHIQSDFHAERFKAFPHVDSPAALIKSLAHA